MIILTSVQNIGQQLIDLRGFAGSLLHKQNVAQRAAQYEISNFFQVVNSTQF